MMDFIKKHLPEQPYIEGIQRFSLRDRILREVALNLIIHREYSSAYPTTFTIYRDRIVTENWNIPYVYGPINLQTMRPHRKNPKIANVFSQMGIVLRYHTFQLCRVAMPRQHRKVHRKVHRK